uniref:Uncharacterized protein n=1 Tax=Anguilla anguilla TaxID=7936 RepID=A0A0E9TUW2_ANGAN
MHSVCAVLCFSQKHKHTHARVKDCQCPPLNSLGSLSLYSINGLQKGKYILGLVLQKLILYCRHYAVYSLLVFFVFFQFLL